MKEIQKNMHTSYKSKYDQALEVTDSNSCATELRNIPVKFQKVG